MSAMAEGKWPSRAPTNASLKQDRNDRITSVQQNNWHLHWVLVHTCGRVTKLLHNKYNEETSANRDSDNNNNSTMDNNKTWVTEVISIYWEQNLEMIQTFRIMTLGDGEMWNSVVWKWQNAAGRRKKVMEAGIRFPNIINLRTWALAGSSLNDSLELWLSKV